MDVFSAIADSLSQSDFLMGIDAKSHSSIFHRGNRIDVQSGETVFSQGDPARKCYFVLAGLIKLTKFHEQGKAVVVRYIKPGELTAAIAVFKENLYPVTAEAVGHSELVGWNKQAMVTLMADYPQLAVNMLGVAFDRLEDLQTRYLELFAEQVEKRIARALLRIMRQSGRKTNEGILIDFPLSRHELAEYTGTTVYTVSRALSAWEKKGWVISRRERIIVSDPHALVLFTENR
ncbi:MAG: Crp/Fnr family transcriptional regulator [bacterium]|nr:Crp/Fnr family transcriptional regulator [bacterium]